MSEEKPENEKGLLERTRERLRSHPQQTEVQRLYKDRLENGSRKMHLGDDAPLERPLPPEQMSAEELARQVREGTEKRKPRTDRMIALSRKKYGVSNDA